ncbi:hypothetical protein OIU80_20570 [Flavobacterium sp. LS1R47]|uniref:Uncharacterized protein n=1 Tax=Flavobacterium frigoritolerans TaxID=2987686 RepID=A0A9X3CAQ5_9FLAO|nr:hypothetical protein [Flavobacterium frigoritolerans]MCV9934682.1 hypothetical protein [Flavobacterium frigoritolerans]
MEIMGFFKTKKMLFICLMYTVFCCKGENNDNITTYKSNTSVIIVNESCFVKQKIFNEKDDKELIYKYENEIYEIKSNKKQAYDIVLNGKKYLSNLNLESANINFYYYKCMDKKVFLIEGDDYYSSVFFAYLFENEVLYYLGNFDINQPNVENSGVLKKDFKILANKDQLTIDLLLRDKFFKTFNLKQKKITPKEVFDSKINLNGLWRLNCENSLTTFDISNKSGYLSLYSDNLIYINVEIIYIEDKIGEYYIKFKSTESQQSYSGDKKSIDDSEISKSENIGRLVIKNDELLLYWEGLYNDKTKKKDFELDFVLIKENEGVNPVKLIKCE